MTKEDTIEGEISEDWLIAVMSKKSQEIFERKGNAHYLTQYEYVKEYAETIVAQLKKGLDNGRP